MSTRAQQERVDLGLAILSVLAIPGEPLTMDDIAAWCDCSRQAIEQIERKALKKIRNALFFSDRQTWNELKGCLSSEQKPARRKNTSHTTGE